MTRHTKLFGSTSYRTLQCPAHLQLGKDIPEPPQSEAAAEGSMLHALCEDILKNDDGLYHFRKDYLALTDDQKNIVDTYVGLVRELADDTSALRVEWFASHPHIHPEWFGTADAVVLNSPRLTIVDLKCGRIPVEIYEQGTFRPNPQVGFYALNVLEDMEPAQRALYAEIELIIVQPREGGIKRAVFTRDDLDELKERLLVSADEAEGEDPTAVVGPACHFCKVKPVCPKYAEHIQREAMMDFAQEDGDTAKLTPLQLERVLAVADMAIEWGNAVKAEGQLRLERGENVQGWQLVPKKARRDWIDQKEAGISLLKQGMSSLDIYPVVVISPAQAEVIAKQKKIKLDLSDLTENISSGLKIGRMTDDEEEDNHGWD